MCQANSSSIADLPLPQDCRVHLAIWSQICCATILKICIGSKRWFIFNSDQYGRQKNIEVCVIPGGGAFSTPFQYTCQLPILMRWEGTPFNEGSNFKWLHSRKRWWFSYMIFLRWIGLLATNDGPHVGHALYPDVLKPSKHYIIYVTKLIQW